MASGASGANPQGAHRSRQSVSRRCALLVESELSRPVSLQTLAAGLQQAKPFLAAGHGFRLLENLVGDGVGPLGGMFVSRDHGLDRPKSIASLGRARRLVALE